MTRVVDAAAAAAIKPLELMIPQYPMSCFVDVIDAAAAAFRLAGYRDALAARNAAATRAGHDHHGAAVFAFDVPNTGAGAALGELSVAGLTGLLTELA